MKKFFIALILSLALVNTVTMTLFCESAPAKATDFELTDLRTGESVMISSLCKEKPLLINFWASWCPPCVREMPELNEVYAKYNEKINFAAVSVDTTSEEARVFVRENGEKISLPFYYCNDLQGISNIYDITVIPITLIVLPSGQISVRKEGAMSFSGFEDIINDAL